MRTLLLAVLLAAAPAARAATISGADYAGADLSPSNGDVLSGTFLNVRLFSVAAGATVYVDVGTRLEIYASTVSVAGTLDASGRGKPGGSGGAVGASGLPGFGGGPTSTGAGSGGGSAAGGGGGAYGGAGGAGSGSGAGAGGTAYGSTSTYTAPLSSDDAFLGSGGGGGGGAAGGVGGTGASGGGAIYIEASSMTVTGSILAQGSQAAAVTNNSGVGNPGGGGGGSGGGILLRVTGPLSMSGATVSASGGSGGAVFDPTFCGTAAPGGGGGGGRVKLFARLASFVGVTVSTAAGAAGSKACGIFASPAPSTGNAGSAAYGALASSPTAFAAGTVAAASIGWSWAGTASWGDAPSASRAFRVFPSTAAAPLTAPQATAAAAATGLTESGLTPNTTYQRFATAFTDWGDSAPSDAVSTHTLASAPSLAGFTAYATTSLTPSWSAGSPANPGYTVYEVESSTDPGFSPSVTVSTAGLGYAAGSLTPNTTYHFRVRAVNLDAVPTAYTASTAAVSLAAAPASPAVGPVFVSSLAFSWSTGANPSDTQYEAEISSDNFFTLVATSMTLSPSATFFNLSPGTNYFLRARAVNRASVATAYSTSVSTKAGVLNDTTPPSTPGTPVADRQFSYDGTVVFSWSAATSGAGILNYDLLIGSFPGGNDVFNGTANPPYTASGLASGRTYYAEVRARTNAGVVGPFSSISVGVPVYRTATEPAIAKPFVWPNPFDPARGALQIGYSANGPGDLVLRVYSLEGRLLRETTQSIPAAGNQIATWDGADSSGRRAAPGGYILVLEKRTASGRETQKVKAAVLY